MVTILQMKSHTSESESKKKDSEKFTSRYPILKWTLLILPLLLLMPLMVADIQVRTFKIRFFSIEKSNYTKLLFQPHAAARCAAVLLLMAVYWWVSHYSFISLSVSLKNQDWWGPSPAHHLPSPCNPLPFTWSHLN